METFLIIVLLTVLAPISYIQAFLVLEFRKKYGLSKFIGAMLLYLLMWLVDVHFLTAGIFNLTIFLLTPIIFQLLGIMLLWQEFKLDIKNELFISAIIKLISLGNKT